MAHNPVRANGSVDAATAPGDATPTNIPKRTRVYTVGHSNQPIEQFIHLLRSHEVDVLVDVRSSPRSRFVPHFDRRALEAALVRAGIRYVYFGHKLGGRPRDGSFYDDDGSVVYERIAETEEFGDGLSRVIRGAQRQRVALMCSEEDPRKCHRHMLIARELKRRSVEVHHIRRDGSLDQAAALGDRAPQLALFRDAEDPGWTSSP